MTTGSARRSSHSMEYGVSLLGVTTVVSCQVNTRAWFDTTLYGALYSAPPESTTNEYCTA